MARNGQADDLDSMCAFRGRRNESGLDETLRRGCESTRWKSTNFERQMHFQRAAG